MPEAENGDFLENQLEESLETAVSGGAPEPEGSPGEAPSSDVQPEAPAVLVPEGPGKVQRALSWLSHWHPLLFLGVALGLLYLAWRVYPEPEVNAIPPAEEFYNEGLDRLYRVMNPDLPLRAATPADEALAARNALLNLLVFYRGSLTNYPQFINPHLLLAEADFQIARHYPDLADKYFADALEAYSDALAWETREDSPSNLALYVKHNYLLPGEEIPDDTDPTFLVAYFANHEDEIAMRRKRRSDYIRFRQAEASIHLKRSGEALQILEQTALETRNRRHEDLRSVLAGEQPFDESRRRAFELGPDEYLRLPLLLGRSYDHQGRLDQAKIEYLIFLGSGSEGRDRIFVLGRLADISMQDGLQYKNVNLDAARKAFDDATQYYDDISSSPDGTPAERDAAVLGSARAYSALASLSPPVGKMVVDELAEAGKSLQSWLETLSGQSLPRRVLDLPVALGASLGRAESVAPGPFALPSFVSGRIAALAGGKLETPYSRRWDLLRSAIGRYDRIAADNPNALLGTKAAVMAARESLNLGLRNEAEARFKTLLDPLSSDEVNLAARLGLAEIALDRGDLAEADLLILGGRDHPTPMWLTLDDADWLRFAARLGNPSNRAGPNFWLRLWELLSPEGRDIAAYTASGRNPDDLLLGRLLKSLNGILRQKTFYDPAYFTDLEPGVDLAFLLSKDPETLVPQEVIWRNRLLFEAFLPYELVQKASRDNIAYAPFPLFTELDPSGLSPPSAVGGLLARLARAWSAAAAGPTDPIERMRLLLESASAYEAALNAYRFDPGELLPELAVVYEKQGEIREEQGNHREALSLTAKAARTYLAVSSRARGSPREMASLLSAADAFFRSGLLERTIEALNIFQERFGYTAPPGSETSMSVAEAENLLGRAYWFLGSSAKAGESFLRNIKRRTPERYKSIYYLGRVMMEQADAPGGNAALLGDPARPLPDLDRDGDPKIESALQAFNYLRQDQGINPNARAWRWSTFDSARLAYIMAERARREAEQKSRQAAVNNTPPPAEEASPPAWLTLYDNARLLLTEALERYPLRSNGGPGLSVRVEPEDYADLMASRFESEYMLANAIIRLSDGRADSNLAALARAHLANLSDPSRYANALFDASLDRFQLNGAVIREAIEGGSWNTGSPLPRTHLGDDEGPTHSPSQLRELLKNSMLLLAFEYFRAAERQASVANEQVAAEGLYRQSYDAYQALYDRFGAAYGSQAMLGMADVLSRLGRPEAAANHYRMAENIARMQPADVKSDGLLDIGPGFWGQQAASRLRDQTGGYRVP